MTAATALRDYNTDGVTASGAYKPQKSVLRTLFGGYEAQLAAAFQNSQLAQVTTSWTVDATAQAKTIPLAYSGTGKVKALTFGPAAPVTDFWCYVVNTGSRKWILSFNGTKTKVWPGQCRFVVFSNAVWNWNPYFERFRPPAGTQVNVDVALGDPDNDGLATGLGALDSAPNAWTLVRDYTDGDLSIQCLPGQTHAPWGTLIGDKASAAYRNISITGDDTYANPPLIQCVGGDVGAHFRDAPLASLAGFKLQSSGSGSVGIQMDGLAYVDLRSMVYGLMANGLHVKLGEKTLANSTLAAGQTVAEKITGGATAHWDVGGQSQFLVSGNVDLTNATPDFSGAAFAITDKQSSTELSYGSPTAFLNGAIVGPGKLIQRHSCLYTNGATLPGTAGTVDATSTAY